MSSTTNNVSPSSSNSFCSIPGIRALFLRSIPSSIPRRLTEPKQATLRRIPSVACFGCINCVLLLRLFHAIFLNWKTRKKVFRALITRKNGPHCVKMYSYLFVRECVKNNVFLVLTSKEIISHTLHPHPTWWNLFRIAFLQSFLLFRCSA